MAAVPPVILLGLGFTTSRLARRLLLRGGPQVIGVARQLSRFEHLAALGVRIEEYSRESVARLPKGAVIVHTIPPLPEDEREELHRFIGLLEPQRVVYISSTSVYGEQTFVTALSAVAPSEPKGAARFLEEQWLMSQPWAILVVRPAAIYGPGRGIHTRIREGRALRTGGSGVVSRIHVDDLAAILEAALNSELEGAWPCSDQRPCTSDEIALWCSDLLKIEPPATGMPQAAGRNVDGQQIRHRLGLSLIYPDYRAGTLASLSEEDSASALHPWREL